MNEQGWEKKRRLVREDLSILMSDCYTQEGSACKLHPVFQPQKAINGILNCLNKWGIKIVDEKAELPSNPFRDISFTQAVGWDCGKFDMLKAGFQKTHPLIEEGE